MSWNKIDIVSEQTKTSLVCVDSYSDGLLGGRFLGGIAGEELIFLNLVQLLLLQENVIKEIKFPDSYTKLKWFSPVCADKYLQENLAQPIYKAGSGKLATFSVKILFRQNASWQGVISWLEGKKELPFRSALEMIRLMISVLENPEN